MSDLDATNTRPPSDGLNYVQSGEEQHIPKGIKEASKNLQKIEILNERIDGFFQKVQQAEKDRDPDALEFNLSAIETLERKQHELMLEVQSNFNSVTGDKWGITNWKLNLGKRTKEQMSALETLKTKFSEITPKLKEKMDQISLLVTGKKNDNKATVLDLLDNQASSIRERYEIDPDASLYIPIKDRFHELRKSVLSFVITRIDLETPKQEIQALIDLAKLKGLENLAHEMETFCTTIKTRQTFIGFLEQSGKDYTKVPDNLLKQWQDRFVVIKTVGKGSFKTVERALDQAKDGKEVAIARMNLTAMKIELGQQWHGLRNEGKLAHIHPDFLEKHKFTWIEARVAAETTEFRKEFEMAQAAKGEGSLVWRDLVVQTRMEGIKEIDELVAVMDYHPYSGQDLIERVREVRTLHVQGKDLNKISKPQRDAARWIGQPRFRVKLATDMCDAADALHQKGLLHRDLKPANFLIGEVNKKPKAVVADFGAACRKEDEKARENYTCTPWYATPKYLIAAGHMLAAQSEEEEKIWAQEIKANTTEALDTFGIGMSLVDLFDDAILSDDLDKLDEIRMRFRDLNNGGQLSAFGEELGNWVDQLSPPANPFGQVIVDLMQQKISLPEAKARFEAIA